MVSTLAVFLSEHAGWTDLWRTWRLGSDLRIMDNGCMGMLARWTDPDAMNVVKEVQKWWKPASEDPHQHFWWAHFLASFPAVIFGVDNQINPRFQDYRQLECWDKYIYLPKKRNQALPVGTQGLPVWIFLLYGFGSLGNLPGLSPHFFCFVWFFSSLKFAVGVLLCLFKPCHSWWPWLCFYCKLIWNFWWNLKCKQLNK